MTLRARVSAARRRYRANRTNANLRRYLTLKARLRRWDDRYCAYYGVSPRVNVGCRRAIMRGYVAGLVPSSTTGGSHSAHSYHKTRNAKGEGQAVDLGLRHELVGTAKGVARLVRFQRAELARWRRGRGYLPVELLGPDNLAAVLKGRETDLAEGSPLETQHDNHVHEAYTG